MTEEFTIENIQKYVDRGLPYNQVCEKFGLTYQTFMWRKLKLKGEIKKYQRRKFSDNQVREIHKDRESGLSFPELSHKWGSTKQTMRRIVDGTMYAGQPQMTQKTARPCQRCGKDRGDNYMFCRVCESDNKQRSEEDFAILHGV